MYGMYMLFVWVQYMQRSTKTPFAMNHRKGMAGICQSTAEILHLLSLSSHMGLELSANGRDVQTVCTGTIHSKS